jgi:hypothetical protein
MKKNFEDLQKFIDYLNSKTLEISDQLDELKEKYKSEDLEKDKDIEKSLEDRLD